MDASAGSSEECRDFQPTVANAKIFSSDVAPCFYSWREIFPELELLHENIDTIREESKAIGQVYQISHVDCVS